MRHARHVRYACALIGAVLLLHQPVSAGDGAPDPQEIAQACIQQTAARATMRAQWNAAAADHCAAQIEVLLDDGQEEQAQQLAQMCAARITARSHLTVHRIMHRCHHCIFILLQLEAPGLAMVVHQACETAVGVVQASRAQALAVIQEALGG